MTITKVRLDKVLDLHTKEKELGKIPYKFIKWFEIDGKYEVSEIDLVGYVYNRKK